VRVVGEPSDEERTVYGDRTWASHLLALEHATADFAPRRNRLLIWIALFPRDQAGPSFFPPAAIPISVSGGDQRCHDMHL
jgi:hypothetical protein